MTNVSEAQTIPAILSKANVDVNARSQGVVTGRIYDQLSQPNAGPFQAFYNWQLGWIRIEFEEFYYGGNDFNDPQVQAEKDKFQRVIDNAKARGLNVLAVVGLNAMPHKDANNNNILFPYNDDLIARYVSAVNWHLQNYQGIDAIEIWNEPHKPNLKNYAKMLIQTYQSLKPQYQNVLFVGPATDNAEHGDWLGNDDNDWENSIFNCTEMLNYRSINNGALPLDIISYHPYGTQGDPTGDFYFGSNFTAYYDTILAYTDRQGRNIIGNYPIWFTEYGWDSNGVGTENQRIYLEKMMGLIYERPQVKVSFWYDFRDDEPGPGSENKACGLKTSLANGNQRKRAFFPFVSHNSLVGLFTPDGQSEWTIDEIVNKYLDSGARNVLGHAYRAENAPWYGDKAHYWGPNNNGIIQQFDGGQLGQCAITRANPTDASQPAPQAWLIKGAFYQYYIGNNGPYAFGWPTSDEYVTADGTYQNFERGKMQWTGADVVWMAN